MKTVQGILGNAKLSFILQSVKLITVRCHGTFHLTISPFCCSNCGVTCAALDTSGRCRTGMPRD